jgi:TPR repeat protein
MLELGDIPAARLVLRRAAEAGNSEAAFMLASTFDPNVLRELGVIGFPPELGQALAWYEKASAFGLEKAKRSIERLRQAGDR